MKRSGPIRRKTPLARGKSELKRTRLKRMGNVKKRELAIEAPIVAEYRKLFPKCQYCGQRKASELHEIFSQGRRHVARIHRSCVLHLCHGCHELLQHAPKPLQLAVKFTSDRKGFDLLEYCRLSPGEPVSMSEIERHLPPF